MDENYIHKPQQAVTRYSRKKFKNKEKDSKRR